MKNTISKIIVLALTVIFVTIFSGFFDSAVFAAKSAKSGPAAPAKLQAATITDTSVTLSWSRPKDKVKTYDIYCNNTYLASATTTTYTVKGLTPATNYEFYVKAKNFKGGISESSNTVSVTTISPVPEPTIPEPVMPEPVTPKPPAQTSSRKIVGYYAAWAAYSGYLPNQIDASKLTHINYAFANISSDLKLALGYPDIDENNIKLLNSLKQTNPNLKTLISVGGWTWSGKFSDAALTDASRTTFADSCVAFMKQYGFDGVDLDWEYPVSGGLATNTKRPEDKQNFTLLLQKIREKLDAQGVLDNKHYLLTIAGGAGNSYVNNIEIANVSQYLDYATIMTYDLHGMWDSYTDLHAPLYMNDDTSPQYKASVDSAVNAWLNASFPADKLVLGIPFYGYLFSSVNNTNNGLYQTYTGANSIGYQSIVDNYMSKPGFTRYFHAQSMVPWLFDGSVFISYEDPQSIAYKTDYIKSKNLGGAMAWELSQDPNEVLLGAIYDGMK
ncbi:MAG TPA: glycosyl hydrolase family 18 protein [Lachnospiraceae bacterium]|nr:glycosyl hydrolase family 18 protein [Lachnospiraceae bacterium]